MWGNTRGWLIASPLACLLGVLLYWLISLGQISAPTSLARDPANFLPVALPIPPETVWPLATQDLDAGPLYQKIIDGWDDQAHHAAVDLIEHPDAPLPPTFQALIDARHAKRMTLFVDHLPDFINYDASHPGLDGLFDAGDLAVRAALAAHQHGLDDRCVQLLESAFSLGRFFYTQRIVFDEYQKGVTLMADASATMQAILVKGSARYDALDEFNHRRQDYEQSHVMPIWLLINSASDEVTDHTAGDVAAFATKSAERLWRVEATLKLGRYRFNAASHGDQLGAAALLARLQQDPDPAVAQAARAATSLTIETYRMIH